MPTVLVVDDSAKDRSLAGGLLAKDDNTTVAFAINGREALAVLQTEPPDLVVSDLQMPEMNGLELVEAMRKNYPAIPIVLMTAKGSEEIASEALRKGAAGYVPKIALGKNLRSTVRRLLADAQADRLHSRLMHSLASCDCVFQLNNDPELFDALVSHIQELLRCLPLGDEAERLRVSIALRHALWIAHAHGNLEIPISLHLDDNEYESLVRSRVGEDPYGDRSLEVRVVVGRNEAVLTLTHGGPPIDTSMLAGNMHEEAVDRAWLGRFVLIPSVIDDVSFEDGRTIRLVKRSVHESDDIELG